MMNILSMFDGMSCGRIALDRAGISVNKYYASEIDKYAIKVAQANYPDTVQLGDCTSPAFMNWVNAMADKGGIDMLIGGSPCQGFSSAGRHGHFDDPRSKLFWTYVKVLRKLQPRYFFLENVKMKQSSMDIISDALDVEPVFINSDKVSAHNRQRYYWTNIPLVSTPAPVNEQVLGDVLEDDVPEKYSPKPETLAKWDGGTQLNPSYNSQGNRIHPLDQKAATVCAGSHGYNYGYINQNGRIRRLTPLEFERLQTVPDNYTEGVSDTQRYKMLGNGWTVDIIAHLFKNLKLAYA